MSTFSFETLTWSLITFLRSKIVDPISRGSDWIYPDYPRADATMPRLSLIQTGSFSREQGVGDQGTYWDVTFDIDVWVNKRSIATISGSKYTGSKLRNYLADKVVSAVLDNRSDLTISPYNLMGTVIGSVFTHPYDEELELYRKTIPVTVSIRRIKIS